MKLADIGDGADAVASRSWLGTTAFRLNSSVRLNIAATGSLKVPDSAQPDCTYSGTNAPHPAGVAVFNVDLAANCAGTPKTYSGVATFTADKTGMPISATTPDQSEGDIFRLGRAG